jgi:predicted secreted protein
MKKIILSLTALMAVGFASAQSYPKQPDRTVVNYVEYKKEAKTESEPVEQQTVENTLQVQEPKQDEATIQQPAASVNSNTVTENRRNDKARKE